MNDCNVARHTAISLFFNGTDMTATMEQYLLSLHYTDNEEDESDDLQIALQDRAGIWMKDWISDSIEDSSGGVGGAKIKAIITQQNWDGTGRNRSLPCGLFELDRIDAGGPPATINLNATALPFSCKIRQTKQSKAWESYSLSAIAREMAHANGMDCIYESNDDPHYERVEQYKISDISFLSQLCHDEGISLKATNHTLVLFNQVEYEKKDAVLTLKHGQGYSKYKLSMGEAGTQFASCKVSYINPEDGNLIEATVYVEDYDAQAKNNQQLTITAKVRNIMEAKHLAEKRLRLCNKFAKTATFTIAGDVGVVAGVVVLLQGFGVWDGRYMVSQAKHSVGSSGYTTQLKLRQVLEGY